MSNYDDYDPDVNYDELEQHTYSDVPGHIFYTCPICGEEYISTFIISHKGRTMCTDCYNRYEDQ